MSNRFWRGVQAFEQRARDEKACRRQFLAAWDAKWHGLSVQARHLFVHEVKIPNTNPGGYSSPPSVSIDRVPPPVLKELTDAGFVEVKGSGFGAQPDRVIACDSTRGFASRIRTLRRLHLLGADQPSEIAKYIDEAFLRHELTIVLESVLQMVGVAGYVRLEHILDRYVTHHRWPGWVAESLKNPVAQQILDVVREAGNAIPLAELPNRIEKSSPEGVRLVVNELVGHLALFEDLHPETWELMVGLLPAVREKMILASQPRRRPSLIVCDRPKEVGPHGSVLINDLRAVLLEIAGAPPRLRRDFDLYQKESQRFRAALEPLSPWLVEALRWPEEVRLSEAIAWARELHLVKQVPEEGQIRLHLSSKGHDWVSSGFEEQYAMTYDRFTAVQSRDELFSAYGGLYSYSKPTSIDVRFLGAQVTVLRVKKGENVPESWAARKEDHQALRQHLDRGLAELKPGVFYRLDSVESHVAFGVHNPVNRGLVPEQVAVLWAGQAVPPIEEDREEKGKLLIKLFVCQRLIPLGCFRAAIDDAGSLCIAREPRYDLYFGRKIDRTDLAPTLEVAGRVVVQPDFSVIVIGANPAAVADLAPFCERTTRGSGQGAMVLKITRESVVKAVNLGLVPAEILARLERHTSKQLPANVLREVKDWSNWVRRVTFAKLTVLRCPDADTVDRVIAAMGRNAERVSDKLVAIDRAKLTPAQRDKLKNHGIIVQSAAEAREAESYVL
jgi:XPB/Ssl2-like helicase family protein